MKEFDIHHSMPSVEVAMHSLDMYISLSRSGNFVIKIIHGYGSSGRGGAIKLATRENLDKKQAQGMIKAYIPGEAISTPMGFDDLIRKYRNIIQNDSDFKKGNDGITYVFFK